MSPVRGLPPPDGRSEGGSRLGWLARSRSTLAGLVKFILQKHYVTISASTAWNSVPASVVKQTSTGDDRSRHFARVSISDGIDQRVLRERYGCNVQPGRCDQRVGVSFVAGRCAPWSPPKWSPSSKIRWFCATAAAVFAMGGRSGRGWGVLPQSVLARDEARDEPAPAFEQIQGFGEYGFPEGRAASFALIAYAHGEDGQRSAARRSSSLTAPACPR